MSRLRRFRPTPYRGGLELLLGPVDVQQGRDAHQEPPPGPAAHAHILPHVLLDTADSHVLDLRGAQVRLWSVDKLSQANP